MMICDFTVVAKKVMDEEGRPGWWLYIEECFFSRKQVFHSFIGSPCGHLWDLSLNGYEDVETTWI